MIFTLSLLDRASNILQSVKFILGALFFASIAQFFKLVLVWVLEQINIKENNHTSIVRNLKNPLVFNRINTVFAPSGSPRLSFIIPNLFRPLMFSDSLHLSESLPSWHLSFPRSWFLTRESKRGVGELKSKEENRNLHMKLELHRKYPLAASKTLSRNDEHNLRTISWYNPCYWIDKSESNITYTSFGSIAPLSSYKRLPKSNSATSDLWSKSMLSKAWRQLWKNGAQLAHLKNDSNFINLSIRIKMKLIQILEGRWVF